MLRADRQEKSRGKPIFPFDRASLEALVQNHQVTDGRSCKRLGHSRHEVDISRFIVVDFHSHTRDFIQVRVQFSLKQKSTSETQPTDDKSFMYEIKFF